MTAKTVPETIEHRVAYRHGPRIPSTNGAPSATSRIGATAQDPKRKPREAQTSNEAEQRQEARLVNDPAWQAERPFLIYVLIRSGPVAVRGALRNGYADAVLRAELVITDGC